MKKFIVAMALFISAFLAFSIPALADETDAVTPTGFGIGFGAWINPRFSGSTKAGSSGTEISFRDNLGLKNQNIYVPHLWYRWAHGQIFDARYNQISEAVSATLGVPETFQGIVYPAGTPVTTTTKLQWADLSYELPIAYDEYPPQKSYLNALIDIKALRGTFTISGSPGTTAHAPITVPYPLLGIHGKYQMLRDASFEFKLAGMRFGLEDSIGYSYDAEAGVNEKLLNNIELTGKYRYFTFYDRDADDNRFNFRLFGPEVDLSSHF